MRGPFRLPRPADGVTLSVPTSGAPATLTRAKFGRVTLNPYANADWTNQHKANLHTHTTESDGALTVAEVIDEYHDAGYTILGLTDHDTSSGDTPTWPWTDFDRDPATLGMVGVKGTEISRPDDILSYFSDFAAAETETAALEGIQAAGGLGVFAHPGRYAGATRPASWYANHFLTYSSLCGWEAYNQGNRYVFDRIAWDAVNTLLAPHGRVAWGWSNDDMHTSNQLFRNYQHFMLPELTEAAVKAAMAAGATYFSYEAGGSGNALAPRITSISLSEENSRITVISPDAGTVVWRSNAGQVGTGATLNVRHLPGPPLFVRAELENAGGRSYTQPFLLAFEDEV